MILAGGLLLGNASTSDAQAVISFGRSPAVVVGQPYGNGYGNGYAQGYGYNSYRPAAPYVSNGYTATTYGRTYGGYAPGYAPYAGTTNNYYSRAYSGAGYAPSYGAYAPYGGYARPNYGYAPGGYRAYGRR